MSDTLTALQQALKPKTGMQRIPFPTESYQHPSKPLSAKRLLNVHIEQEPADARTGAALVSTSGLTVWGTHGSGPIQAMSNEMPGIAYIVSGTHLFRLTGLLFNTTEDLGDIGSITSVALQQNLMITIAAGVNAAVVCVPPRAYTCGHALGSPLNEIGGDFPGARSVAYLDGYFVFTSDDDDGQFFTSLLLDPLAYDALDFAFADGVPNVVRRVVSFGGDLWMFGDAGIEPWYDAGAPTFPFLSRKVVIPYAVGSIKTIVELDGSLFWVGPTGIAYRSQGYKAVRVSTHAVEEIIKALGLGAGGVVGAVGYAERGHSYYCIQCVTRTLVYDCATQKWADRSSSTDGVAPWRPIHSMQASDLTLLGDRSSNKIFTPSPADGTEDGITVIRQLVMPPLFAGTNRSFMNRVEIEMEITGLDVILDWSDDGGFTWRTPARVMNTLSTIGSRKRVYTTRLGSFRQRVLRFTFHGHVTVYAVDADITGPPNTSGG